MNITTFFRLIFCLTLVILLPAAAQNPPSAGLLPLPSIATDSLLRPPAADTELAPNAIVISNEPIVKKPMLWKVSVATFAAANVLDVTSSWGKRELNPALSAPSAKFGASSLGLKAGIVGTVIGVEYLLTRGHPRPGVYRALAIVNFCDAGAVGGVAARNFTIPAYSH